MASEYKESINTALIVVKTKYTSHDSAHFFANTHKSQRKGVVHHALELLKTRCLNLSLWSSSIVILYAAEVR